MQLKTKTSSNNQKAWFIAVLILLLASNAFAHGGGLDKYGGHNDRKRGEYHFHRGPLAGQHFLSKEEAIEALHLEGEEVKAPPPSSNEKNTQNLAGIASVIDGDTIEIHGKRIRLYGIDTPESSQLCDVGGKPWRCGQAAANKLSDKIWRKFVRCEKRDVDRYGRVVAVCYADNEDLNAWLVSEGLAVAYRKYSTDYVGLEEQARAARKGVWGSKFDMPWDWRKANR